MTDRGHLNRLASETSPYLLQHAHNPVDWFPWGREALEKARREHKPILLSIGYSACHWCHVMAHESFEDPATAEVMNRLFVNIKVDREERPDLDRIYQTAHQLLTRQPGGWPLTVFLSPDDQMPFFSGTYFPREPGFGRPGFRQVLERIHELFFEHDEEIDRQSMALTRALEQLSEPGEPGQTPDEPTIGKAIEELREEFDARHGGFRGAPKFPQPQALALLMGDADSAWMAIDTLEKMAAGGIYDQVGGGFFRYSVDERWEIPHFEKMLYDNALLLPLYARAGVETGSPNLTRTAVETAHWVMAEMQGPEGGYFSSLDADTEGGEGRYYTWSRQEVTEALNETQARLFARAYGMDGPANFEGRWHLQRAVSTEALAEEEDLPPADIEHYLEQARQWLQATRSQRPAPGRDDKVLCAWNALMIRGMARAARDLRREALADSAQQALDFLHHAHWRDGRLWASHREGDTAHPAYLDDHAFLIDALLEMLQLRWRDADLRWAMTLADQLLERFQHPEGGFFFTASDHESLIQRPMPLGDDALPSGNAVAARALDKLGHLTGDPRYRDAARHTLEHAQGAIHQAPVAHCGLLTAQADHLHPPETIIVRGPAEALDPLDWLAPYTAHVYPLPSHAEELPEGLAEKPAGPELVAYPCRGLSCQPPVRGREAVAALLAERRRPG